MKAITSKQELIKKLKKHNILYDGRMFYLTDFHRTKVGKSLVNKLYLEGYLEPYEGGGSWFEKCLRLREPIHKYYGVEIYHDIQNNNYFFRVKKSTYLNNSISECLKKIDYLKTIGTLYSKK